jgi:hypothetical protein
MAYETTGELLESGNPLVGSQHPTRSRNLGGHVTAGRKLHMKRQTGDPNFAAYAIIPGTRRK